MVPDEKTDQEFQALILERLESLHAKLDVILERLPVVDRTDIDLAERLFPALAGAIGSEKFTASEALEYPAVKVVVGRMNAVTLGQFLGRIERRTIGGFRIYRHSVGKKTTLWSLMRVVE